MQDFITIITITITISITKFSQNNSRLIQSTIREIFAFEIRIPGKFNSWNTESWALESGKQLKESGIPLTIGIQNPSSINKD